MILKKRYILAYFQSKDNFEKKVQKVIAEKISYLFGSIGLYSIRPKVMFIESNFIVVRCNYLFVDELLFTLCCIKSIAFLNLKVSGSIKKLQSIIDSIQKEIQLY